MSDDRDDISPEIFAHLVDLAALELSAEEAEYLRAELNSQLAAIRELEAIRVDPDVPIASHGVPYSAAMRPALREDSEQACEQAGLILQGGPEVEEGYFVVPDIPHEELE